MIRHFTFQEMPHQLQVIEKPPSQLFMRAQHASALDDIMLRKRVAIVGTRRVSSYGLEVTRQFASFLAARGIVIVSGLAFGVDAAAHESALEVNGTCVAVLPGAVEEVAPRSHLPLANDIIAKKGILLSEYPTGTPVFPWNFVTRNRIVSGISDALLIIEATADSGTIHTAEYAKDQGVEVLVIPGNITSPTSEGTNTLLKGGAGLVTEPDDILRALDFPEHQLSQGIETRVTSTVPEQQTLIDLIEQGTTQGTQLLEKSGLSVGTFNHHLTMLEISAKIRQLGDDDWALA